MRLGRTVERMSIEHARLLIILANSLSPKKKQHKIDNSESNEQNV